MNERVILQLIDHVNRIEKDIEVDLDISAHDLFVALNSAMNWGMNPTDSSECYLSSENPIALLRGSASLHSFGLHDGSEIHYIRG